MVIATTVVALAWSLFALKLGVDIATGKATASDARQASRDSGPLVCMGLVLLPIVAVGAWWLLIVVCLRISKGQDLKDIREVFFSPLPLIIIGTTFFVLFVGLYHACH